MDTLDRDAATAAPAGCPRCGKELVDAAGLGWCSACGYCRSLEETAGVQLPREKPPPAEPPPAEAPAPIVKRTLWLWVLLLVIAEGTLACLVIGRELPPGDNLRRAVWTTVQLGVGSLLVFLAQFWVLLNIAPEEPTLTFKDALVPLRLWPMAFARLPRFQGSLWVAGGGFTLVAGALLFIGGLQHWFAYLPGRADARANPTSPGPATPYVRPTD